jgi:hypothetical protein
VEEEVEDTAEAKDHQREVMVEDKVAVTEDLQELRQFMSTFIQHLPHLILSRSQRLPTEADMEVAVNLAAMEDQREAMHLPRFPITNQLQFPNLITNQCLLMGEDMKVAVNLVAMEDQPEVTLLHRLSNPMNNKPQLPNLITNRFLLMAENKEDRQEDTLLP